MQAWASLVSTISIIDAFVGPMCLSELVRRLQNTLAKGTLFVFDSVSDHLSLVTALFIEILLSLELS